MSSILRKAFWPATLIVGMLMLLGAVGTATAPVARAADGDICAIVGPNPVLEVDDDDLLDHGVDGKLLIGTTYLFLIYMEDESSGDEIAASIDDEEGDADITSFADDDPIAYVTLSGVDNLDGLEANTISGWDGGPEGTDFLDNLEDEFGFTIDGDVCGDDSDDGFAIIDVTCEDPGRFELTGWLTDDGLESAVTGEFLCVAPANAATLTAVPTTVESVPARGNISHSLLVVVLTDAAGNPAAPGQRVDWSTDRCLIEGRTEAEYEGTDAAAFAGFTPASAEALEILYVVHDTGVAGLGGVGATSASLSFESDPAGAPPIRTIATAILHCATAAPGVANILAEIERSGADLQARTTVTVVGPPAFITMTAAPSRLICGEKATILVTITDAINQKVSDHTRVELITNFGGVLGGTGGTLGFPGVGVVNPLSSAAAETFGGVATAYLLTSTTHVGAYEVVAASGGSIPTGGLYPTSGVFSTPVVTSQVTVTCTLAAPAVTAPATGTGSISPPNTGDAGLASASSSSAMLYVIFGAVAFVLAGLVSFGYARR